MNIKVLFVALIFLALMLIPFAVSSTFACEPDVSDCYQSTVPTKTSVPPTVVPTSTTAPTSTPTFTPTPTPTSTPTLSPSEIAALNCLLPNVDTSTTPLGVADICGSIPVRISSSRVAAASVATVAKSTPIPLPTPKGDTPAGAMTVSDVLHTLEAGAVHWYRIDNGQNFNLDVWLDTSGKTGITLAVYSPEQTNALSIDLQPKGRGAPTKNDPTHDLLWKGSNATGVWYALVRNYNPFPMQYKIGTNQSSSDRNCFGYWEIDAFGKWIFWVDCGHYPGVPKP